MLKLVLVTEILFLLNWKDKEEEDYGVKGLGLSIREYYGVLRVLGEYGGVGR